jgi:hypothetical protein
LVVDGHLEKTYRGDEIYTGDELPVVLTDETYTGDGICRDYGAHRCQVFKGELLPMLMGLTEVRSRQLMGFMQVMEYVFLCTKVMRFMEMKGLGEVMELLK